MQKIATSGSQILLYVKFCKTLKNVLGARTSALLMVPDLDLTMMVIGVAQKSLKIHLKEQKTVGIPSVAILRVQ